MGFCEFMFSCCSISIIAMLIGAICGEAEGKRAEQEKRERFRRERNRRLKCRNEEYYELAEILSRLPDNQQAREVPPEWKGVKRNGTEN